MEIIEMIFTEEFLSFIVALSLLMVGNIISGIMKAYKAGKFDWKALLDGIVVYILWLLGAVTTVAAVTIYGGDLMITIGDAEMSLLDGIAFAKKAVYVYWAAKAVQNFIEYGGTKKEVKPVEEMSIAEQLEDEIVG